MRQLLALTLAFYVLALTLVPCVDDLFRQGNAEFAHTGLAATPSHPEEQDCCSPFCTCSCCQVSMETSAPFRLPEPTPVGTRFFFPLTTRMESLSVHAIWEPPKSC